VIATLNIYTRQVHENRGEGVKIWPDRIWNLIMPYSEQTRIRPEAANYAASWMRHVLPCITLQMLPCVVLYIYRNCCILIVAIRASIRLIIRIYRIWISGHLSRLRSIYFLMCCAYVIILAYYILINLITLKYSLEFRYLRLVIKNSRISCWSFLTKSKRFLTHV